MKIMGISIGWLTTFGISDLDINPIDAPINEFFKLISNGNINFFPKSEINAIHLRIAPRYFEIKERHNNILLNNETSYENVRVIKDPDRLKIPNIFTNQFNFVADNIVIIMDESQILGLKK